MSKPFISVVVPVYNSEKWIDKCIDSILAQSYVNFELILIDDGSLDSSFCIMQKYASRDSRIRVYHKENTGVSDTRNFGISQANGDWITFVDSDDSLKDCFLENLLPINSQADLVVCGATVLKKGKEFFNLFECGKHLENGVYRISDIYNVFTNQVFNGPVRKLFKKQIILENKIVFPVNKFYGEDTDFVYSYLSFVDNVQVANYYGYEINLINNQSLSSNVNAVIYYATIKHNYQLYLDFVQQKGIKNRNSIELYYDYNIFTSVSLSYWRKNALKLETRLNIYKELFGRKAWDRIRLPFYFAFFGRCNLWICIDFLRRIHFAVFFMVRFYFKCFARARI